MNVRNLVLLASVLLSAVVTGAVARAQTYTITAITSTAGPCQPYAVNDLGQTTGGVSTSSGPAFVFGPATGVTLLPRISGTGMARGYDINHAGQVVGFSYGGLHGTGFLWDSVHGTREIDLIPDSSGVTAFTRGWSLGSGRAINAAGDILCIDCAFTDPLTGAQTGVGNCIWRMSASSTGTAVSVTRAPVVAQGTFSYSGKPSGPDLNDNGVVLMYATNSSTGVNQSCLWDSVSGAITWIDPSFGQGAALSNYNVGVGATNPLNGFLFTPGTGVSALGSLGGGSWPEDINDLGQVVGTSYLSSKSTKTVAFLWQNGVMRDLSKLTDAGNRWTLTIASGLSRPVNAAGTAGYIVGWGSLNSQSTGYLLTPK